MFRRCSLKIYDSIKTISAGFCTMSEKIPIRKPRYDGRSKKRKWEERRTDQGEAFDVKREKTEDRVKKRKYAILLGYSGSNYFGMQRNVFTKTIEEDLFKALLDSKHINEEAFKHPQTVQFQRAARTDKGVSAARQVVSIKLPEMLDIEKINDNLPEVIRIFGYKRVTKGFNSKSSCDARTYFYMLPTITFSDKEETSLKDFRLSKSTFEKVNELLQKYIGTKNYHNFTSKRLSNDPSCNRYILSFICEEPIIRNDIEFAVLKVKGQSFILHQIRKMIGLTIAVIRGYTTEESFTRAFSKEKINIPRAPGLGLVLDFVHYDRYNARYGEDGMHETLEWKELDETVDQFKEKYIYPTIINTEINENNMISWLEKLSTHSFDLTDDDQRGDNEEDDENSDEKRDDVEESVGVDNMDDSLKDKIERDDKNVVVNS
nr:tRNA pseudouridine synthase A-like [Onthophagus taurus]